MRAPRSRLRTYLALARVSNLPTVWSNVLAGMVLTGSPVGGGRWALLAAGVSLLYCAGMVFNDTADAEIDAQQRADRPIPAGDITVKDAHRFGVVLAAVGAGAVLVARAIPGDAALLWLGGTTVLLGLAIQYYNLRHKSDPLGPLVMGVCRGLVYCVAAAAVVAGLPPAVLAGAAVMVAYVTGLTLVAKYQGARYGWSIAWLIAGISIVDAGLIAAAGEPRLAALALLGFPLTILGQRLVRGT